VERELRWIRTPNGEILQVSKLSPTYHLFRIPEEWLAMVDKGDDTWVVWKIVGDKLLLTAMTTDEVEQSTVIVLRQGGEK